MVLEKITEIDDSPTKIMKKLVKHTQTTNRQVERGVITRENINITKTMRKYCNFMSIN